MSLSDEFLEDMVDYYDTLDAVLVGGNTYFSMAEYWQNAEKTSDSTLERTIAKKINDIKKIVISRSELDLVWSNSEQIIFQNEATLVSEMEQLRNKLTGVFQLKAA